MKNLSEQELLELLQSRRTQYKVSYEEVSHPPYEVWGRAREWSYSQTLCLFSGLMPLAPAFLNLILDSKNLLTLIEWFEFYPIANVDINRLKNFDRLLKGLSQFQYSSLITPKQTIILCKDKADIVPHLPSDLVRIVEEIGPHPSLNLPNNFSQLELNPNHLRDLKLMEKHSATPRSISSLMPMHPNTENQPLSAWPPTPQEPPLDIALRLFPFKDPQYWRKLDALSATEILLLHYNIDPKICEVDPAEPHEDPVAKEFATYLFKHFYGLPQGFLNTIDKNCLRHLLQRSVDAGVLHMVRPNKFSTPEIIKWLQDKNLDFPFIDTIQEQNEISNDEVHDDNFKSLTPNQQLRLMARLSATAIWKQNKNLSLKQVVHHQLSSALRKYWAELHEGDECASRTYEDWVRDLNPNYRPRL